MFKQIMFYKKLNNCTRDPKYAFKNANNIPLYPQICQNMTL